VLPLGHGDSLRRSWSEFDIQFGGLDVSIEHPDEVGQFNAAGILGETRGSASTNPGHVGEVQPPLLSRTSIVGIGRRLISVGLSVVMDWTDIGDKM
jgi:hypothetical protein